MMVLCPRDETLIVGVYVGDCFVLYSHNDESSLYDGGRVVYEDVAGRGVFHSPVGVGIALSRLADCAITQP